MHKSKNSEWRTGQIDLFFPRRGQGSDRIKYSSVRNLRFVTGRPAIQPLIYTGGLGSVLHA
jgi:hypothetical protein